MNSGQGEESFDEIAVREEPTMFEGAIEVVSKTPMASNSGLV